MNNQTSPAQNLPPAVLPATADPKPPTFEQLAEQLLFSSDNSLQRLCELINQDVALRGEVICQANAWIYSLGRPVKDLKQAVTCLGFDRCRSLIKARLQGRNATAVSAQTTPEKKQPTDSGRQSMAGVRPYRKQRLSSLYPPKKNQVRPHFRPGWSKQT